MITFFLFLIFCLFFVQFVNFTYKRKGFKLFHIEHLFVVVFLGTWFFFYQVDWYFLIPRPAGKHDFLLNY